jgi:hypothetical protein
MDIDAGSGKEHEILSNETAPIGQSGTSDV